MSSGPAHKMRAPIRTLSGYMCLRTWIPSPGWEGGWFTVLETKSKSSENRPNLLQKQGVYQFLEGWGVSQSNHRIVFRPNCCCQKKPQICCFDSKVVRVRFSGDSSAVYGQDPSAVEMIDVPCIAVI